MDFPGGGVLRNITDDQLGERFGCGLNVSRVEELFHVIPALPFEPRFLRWPISPESQFYFFFHNHV